MIDLKNLTIKEASQMLERKEISAVDLAQLSLKKIEEKNKELFAFLEIFDDVLEQAKKADVMIQAGQKTDLTGIPIAIKDNILFRGKKCSAGSRMLENYIATYDSFVIQKLKKAGAVIIGRTNMDEFAMGSSTQTSAFGITKNPYDLSRVPGGSSGGSAVAVAAGMVLGALGTETCGSVRQPASLCGLFGLKPTYGLVSRNGIIAMGNSLDQVSPFAKTANDIEIIFNNIKGKDFQDATSVEEKKEAVKIGNKIGIPWHLFEEGVDEEVLANFKKAVEKLKKIGYQIVNIELPYSKYSLAAYYIIMPAEVSTNLSRFDGIRYGLSQDGENIFDVYKKSRSLGFGVETRRRIILGTYVLSHGYYDAYYNQAWKVRRAIIKEYLDIFKKVDFVLTPTTPTPAFKIGEKIDDPVAMYLCDVFAAPANLAGIPALAIPSGFTKDNLPLSIQVMGPNFSEKNLFKIARDFEQNS